MKKIMFMAIILANAFSMISCTADVVEEETITVPVHADGEPGNTPVKPPPPPVP